MSINNSTNNIIKSAGIMGLATSISRVLGFIRDILMAYFFGTGIAAQAFVVSFRIPNMLRDLVGEGSANAAFVPVLSDNLANKSKEEFWDLVHRLFNICVLILSAIAIAGVLLTPLIVRIIAPGFIENPSKLDLTITLTRIIFPYILLVGLAAFSMAVLFTLRSFAEPSFGPCMMNMAFILSILISARLLKNPILGVAAGVLVGGVLQLLIQVPTLLKKGFAPNLRDFSLRPQIHPEIRKMGRLLVPRIFGTAVYQANIFIDTCLASLANIVGEAAVAAIYYANRLVQLPFAIFAIALANASLPTMSTQVAQKDFEGLKNTVSFSLKSIFLIMLPASIGLGVLANDVIKALFQRGHFGAYSTQITSFALQFYAIGLVFYSGSKILASCFYAMKNTKTPVKVAGVCLLINLIFNLILMFPLKVGGLALASSISAAVNFLLLAKILNQHISFKPKEWIDYILRLLASGAVMLLFLIFIKPQLEILIANNILRLSVLIILAALVYFAACLIFRVRQINSLIKWLFQKKA